MGKPEHKPIITNIVLTGMPGTYKTSVGKILAERLSMHFMDTDEYFEFEYSTTIRDCVTEYGEEAFRDLEAKVVDRVYYFADTIIAAGSGAVDRDDNMEKLKRHGIVILLTCEIPELCKRLRGGSSKTVRRPFLKRKLKKIIEQRGDRYNKYADIILDTGGMTAEQVAFEVEQRLAEFYNV